jgi:hypothetical protein
MKTHYELKDCCDRDIYTTDFFPTIVWESLEFWGKNNDRIYRTQKILRAGPESSDSE